MIKLYTSKTFLKMAGGRMHTPHPTPRGSAPGHKLQKPSKESGMFQSLGTICSVFFFYCKTESKGWGAWHNAPLNTLLPRSLRLGACEQIISLFKGS